MYNEVKNKFYEVNSPNNYKRINANHPIDIYLGLNKNLKKSLVIIAEGEYEEPQSSRLITVSISKREDGKVALSFDLLDNSFDDLFYRFCADILESTIESVSKNIIPFIVTRWYNWISLFKNPNDNLLSESEIKGLIGELYFLNVYMFKKYGYEKSLNSWMGPEMSHKDFEINKEWYEIKTINDNALSVKISSLEQLDSNIVGNLVIIKVEQNNQEVENTVSLNSYVNKIKGKLPSNLIYLFEKKLLTVKYFYNTDYDKYIYSIRSLSFYNVKDNFPKIKSDNLSRGIVKVSYEILLSEINEFKVVGDNNEFGGI